MNQIPRPVKVILLCCILLVAVWYLFVPPPGMPHREFGVHLPFRPNHESEISGKVLAHIPNEKGDLDQIVLQTQSGEISIHFPPHAAREVVGIAQVGSTVVAETDAGPGRRGARELVSISNAAGERLLLREIGPPRPMPGREVKIQGIVSELGQEMPDPERSFVVAGTVVLLPPNMAASLFPLLRKSQSVMVTGFERDSSVGFVNLAGRKVVQAKSVKIDSVTYLVH